jgi:sugar phosphate isomerase/epimerase
VIAALELPAVDVGALKGYAHLDPDDLEGDPAAIAARIRRAAASNGLLVSDLFPSFGAGFDDRPLNDPRAGVRAANRRRFLAFIDVARRCGSAGMTLLPGVIHDDLGPQGSLELSAEVFRDYVALATDAGLRLSFEGHMGSVAESPARALALMDLAPGLKITLDYSHFVALGYTESEIDPLMVRTGHFHFRQARPGRVQVGQAEGVLDPVQVVRRLQAAGYDGFFTIEYTWQDWEGCKNVDTIAETVLVRDQVRSLLSQTL